MRIARGAFLAAGLMVVAGLGAEVPVQDVVLKGKVVTLAAALDAKKLGIRVDAEPTANTVVLRDSSPITTSDSLYPVTRVEFTNRSPRWQACFP